MKSLYQRGIQYFCILLFWHQLTNVFDPSKGPDDVTLFQPGDGDPQLYNLSSHLLLFYHAKVRFALCCSDRWKAVNIVLYGYTVCVCL